jgi:hypothetical protein
MPTVDSLRVLVTEGSTLPHVWVQWSHLDRMVSAPAQPGYAPAVRCVPFFRVRAPCRAKLYRTALLSPPYHLPHIFCGISRAPMSHRMSYVHVDTHPTFNTTPTPTPPPPSPSALALAATYTPTLSRHRSIALAVLSLSLSLVLLPYPSPLSSNHHSHTRTVQCGCRPASSLGSASTSLCCWRLQSTLEWKPSGHCFQRQIDSGTTSWHLRRLGHLCEWDRAF